LNSPGQRQALRALFFKYAIDREGAAKAAGRQFVYYTQAETALKILRNREIWLRSASLMNDVSEIQYGMHCMEHALNAGGEHRLRKIIESLHPQLVQQAIAKLRGAARAMFSATYICCVSEHLGGREDYLGRLSMWRAYGGSTGIALVFNATAMFSPSNALSTYSSPVIYKDPVEFAAMFDEVCDRLEANTALIAQHPAQDVADDLYETLHFAVLSTKHPAFEEEREWRVIHAPYHEASNRVSPNVEVVRGVPQIVYKLPLKNVPNEGLQGLETHESMDRIIIGPCAHPTETSFALHEVLRDQGIKNPYDKIVISNVPLRIEE